jgi:TatD DNase family protein
MIDSHCHLTDPRLESQLAAVVSRAFDVGVTRMITIGTDIADDEKVIAVCKGRAFLRCAIGVHPNYVKDAKLEDVDRLRELQKDPSVIALGEMGLDYHYDSPRELQKEFFRRQLALAAELRRPVVIHNREATDDTIAILREFPDVQAVFHCFTGTLEEGRKILEAGYLIGFTGAATFKKNDEIREVARIAPADRILVETDAPYLSPEPMRKQKINEPSLVVHVADVLAKVRGTGRDDIDQMTTANVNRLFGWGDGETDVG